MDLVVIEEDIRLTTGKTNPIAPHNRNKIGDRTETLVIDEVEDEEEVLEDLEMITRKIMIDLKTRMVVIIKEINTMINTNAKIKTIRAITSVRIKDIGTTIQQVMLTTVIDFPLYLKTNST